MLDAQLQLQAEGSNLTLAATGLPSRAAHQECLLPVQQQQLGYSCCQSVSCFPYFWTSGR